MVRINSEKVRVTLESATRVQVLTYFGLLLGVGVPMLSRSVDVVVGCEVSSTSDVDVQI